jgi:hypothetical protein
MNNLIQITSRRLERYLQMTSVLMALKAGFFLEVEPRREIWLIPERIGRNNPQSSGIVANYWGEDGVTINSSWIGRYETKNSRRVESHNAVHFEWDGRMVPFRAATLSI